MKLINLLILFLLDGYIYYDLFNQMLGSNMVRLASPLIQGSEEQQICLSFWYAAFGAGDSALMQVIRQDNSSSNNEMEKVFFIVLFNNTGVSKFPIKEKKIIY